mmetsp:Transcript_64266/g.177837  ORF Transcript_64266/g.177837 Transcript_64266/m.177837 type:complete len:680 (-) Transcript_64266:260-2299(-)
MQSAAVTLALLASTASACTIIAVGKDATTDGSAIVSHNDDAGGGTQDIRLVRVPAADHASGSLRPVVLTDFPYPRIVSDSRGPGYEPVDDQELVAPGGFVPQVPHTYGYWDNIYGLQNEVQLSIAESTCGAKTAGWAAGKGDYGHCLFGVDELSRVALERCDTAKCAVQTMGDLAVEYGFYGSDAGDPAAPVLSGAAEALAVSDKHGEIWLFHVMTGLNARGAVWAAQRVPDDHVSVIANGFVIREMDLDDTANFLGGGSDGGVTGAAEQMGWWDSKSGEPFDFTKAYVPTDDFTAVPFPKTALYVGRRVWRVFDLVAPSQKFDPYAGYIPALETYPVTVQAEHKVSLNDVMSMMRDSYEGTEFDMSKGLAAGPFNNPLRYDGNKDQGARIFGGFERSINTYRTAYTFVAQSRPNLPDDVGGIFWYGQDAPHGTVYVPVYGAMSELPEAYGRGYMAKYDPDSAWWTFNFLNQWVQLRYNLIHAEMATEQSRLENLSMSQQQLIEAQALALGDKEARVAKLEEWANSNANSILDSWKSLTNYLIGKYTNGWVISFEGASKDGAVVAPGYSDEWLEATTYTMWPGKTFNVAAAQSAMGPTPSSTDSASSNGLAAFMFVVLVSAAAAGGVYHRVNSKAQSANYAHLSPNDATAKTAFSYQMAGGAASKQQEAEMVALEHQAL